MNLTIHLMYVTTNLLYKLDKQIIKSLYIQTDIVTGTSKFNSYNHKIIIYIKHKAELVTNT